MEHYMAAWRYEISPLVLKKYFTRLLPSLVKYLSTLEQNCRISARPRNILYVPTQSQGQRHRQALGPSQP